MNLNRTQRAVVYLLFFVSGSTGLIYEILWGRKLNLIFGSTVYAVSTVLTVFFTGLALGAWLIGRWMDRGPNPVRTYVQLEIALGVFGVLSPLIFIGIDWIYFHLQPMVAGGLGGLTAVRFALSFLGLLIPTTLMGATLPVLVKLVQPSDDSVATDAGHLYSVNTLGAALGTILAAIFLIPLLGVNGSLYMTGAVNLGIAATAWALFRGRDFSAAAVERTAARHSSTQRKILWLFAIAGFVSMVLQVAWIRLLIQVTGSTVYTFGLMLAVFIVGIGLGSQIATRVLPRIRNVVFAFAGVELIAAAYSLIPVGYFDQLPLLFVHLSQDVEGFADLLFVKAAINLVLLFVPTLMFGAAFPLVAAAWAEKAEHSGGDVGLVYSTNTIGGVVGSFLGGFFLLPALGAQTTILVMGVTGVAIAAAIASLEQDARRRMLALAASILVLVLGAWTHRTWDPLLISSAPYVNRYQSVEALVNSKRNLLYFDEGVNVNVSVTGNVDPRIISINGKPMASTTLWDVANQYLLGHIPMLLHPDPRSSMVIGLGAGMTFGSLVRHGEPADVIEISPEIVAGARMFGKYNRNALDQPNANLIFDDGRNYLNTTRRKYDVITEDPLDPFFAGSGYLYGLEHFQNAKAKLEPGGVMCQYLPLYQAGLEETRIIVKTFHEVFPYVTAWFAYNDIVLIGTEEPLKIDLANLRQRVARPEIALDLREIGIDNEYDLLAHYLFDQDAIPGIGSGLPINSDDLPIIEYLTPRNATRQTVQENVEYYQAMRAERFPEIVDFEGLSEAEIAEFRQKMPGYFQAREHIATAHLKEIANERGILRELRSAEQATAPHPTATYYAAWMRGRVGRQFVNVGQPVRAVNLLQLANRQRPDYPPILDDLGRALLAVGNLPGARAALERSIELNDRRLAPLPDLARVYQRLRDRDAAREVLDRCLELNPRDTECARVELGE